MLSNPLKIKPSDLIASFIDEEGNVILSFILFLF